MKLHDLASLMKISVSELEDQLKNNDVVELRLNERNETEENDNGKLEVLG